MVGGGGCQIKILPGSGEIEPLKKITFYSYYQPYRKHHEIIGQYGNGRCVSHACYLRVFRLIGSTFIASRI